MRTDHDHHAQSTADRRNEEAEEEKYGGTREVTRKGIPLRSRLRTTHMDKY